MSDDYRLIQMQRQINELQALLDELKTRERDNGWGSVFGRHLALPNLRGFWPMSSADNTGAMYDMSEQGRTLTWVAPVATGIYNNRVPYSEFNATSNLFRADEAGLSVTGSFTIGGWFWVDTSVAASMYFIAKFGTGTPQRSFLLQLLAGGAIRGVVNSSGASAQNVICDTTATILPNTWNHVVMNFTPSTSVIIWVNGVAQTFTTTIPASLFDSTANFRIGANDDAGFVLDGRATLCFLCAAALPDTLLQELYAATRRYFV